MRKRSVALVSLGAVVAACAPNTSSDPASRPVPVNTQLLGPASTTPSVVTTTVVVVTAPNTSIAAQPGLSTTSTTTATTTTTTTTTTLPPALPPSNDGFHDLALSVVPVADVSKPTAVAWRAGDPAMYVSSQIGPIYRFDGDEKSVVIDLTEETFEDAPGSERGVLGVAFDPRDGRMFVDYTDADDDTRVISFELSDGVALPDSRREVLFIDQPGVGHNGGRLVFDRAGNLLIGSGDGGASSGRDAQDVTKLLGAILRITPRLDDEGYDIPPDNPFADGVEDRPEILVRGFRNPWTFSLDDETGEIWIGDVGNNTIEEIDLVRPDQWGANYGWPYFEGTNQRRSGGPEGLVPPVFDYPRADGVAVMAGHVYRGEAIPELRGAYLFGDLTGPVWAIGAEGVSRLDLDRVRTLVGWAEDPAGELYLLGLNDGVMKLVRG